MILQSSLTIDGQLHHFLDLARRYSPLEPGEERTLLARHRDGDPTAIDHLVNANLRYVVDLAVINEDRWEHLPLIDLLAEGATALEIAIRRYDGPRHGPFRLHVIAAIQRAMDAACSKVSLRHAQAPDAGFWQRARRAAARGSWA